MNTQPNVGVQVVCFKLFYLQNWNFTVGRVLALLRVWPPVDTQVMYTYLIMFYSQPCFVERIQPHSSDLNATLPRWIDEIPAYVTYMKSRRIQCRCLICHMLEQTVSLGQKPLSDIFLSTFRLQLLPLSLEARTRVPAECASRLQCRAPNTHVLTTAASYSLSDWRKSTKLQPAWWPWKTTQVFALCAESYLNDKNSSNGAQTRWKRSRSNTQSFKVLSS